MCGIAGFFGYSVTGSQQVLQRMLDAISHRGPDDEGVWLDLEHNLALGHRRLSIVDLSAAGHQPMLSATERYVLVFNGEIYNHQVLRRHLADVGAAPAWHGHSDTETLLAVFSHWGVRKGLEKCKGMFALALWDRDARILTLARDRIGEKPLYYGWQAGVFLFGSELKALKAHPEFQSRINRDALTLLLRHNYIPAPHSIYHGIHKLQPGTYLQLSLQGEAYRNRGLPEPQPYWSLKQVAEGGQHIRFTPDDRETVNALEKVLLNAVREQMVADVPLGAFLSGGVDSSTIVALMQAQCARPVKTFTIGFCEAGYDEAAHAKEVARHLGTDHTELYVSPSEAMDVIPRLPMIYDEPFSDSSQIPTFLVSQMARRQVTVSLSGDAGDELFGGYNRYLWANRIWRTVGWAPQEFRAALSGLLTSLSPHAWNKLLSISMVFLPPGLRYSNPGDKLHKLAEVLTAKLPEDIYFKLVSHWKRPTEVVLAADEPQTVLTDAEKWADLGSFDQRMMYLDMLTYLPDDILVKVDRAAMASGLETRMPFLDHRVIEFASRLPLSMKIRHGKGKWVLRQILDKYVPKELVERPKMGFGVPIGSWLRGPLREWAEELIKEPRLRQEGYFNPGPIRQKWQEHLSGKRNWQYLLWDVLIFQAWLEQSKNQVHGSRSSGFTTTQSRTQLAG